MRRQAEQRRGFGIRGTAASLRTAASRSSAGRPGAKTSGVCGPARARSGPAAPGRSPRRSGAGERAVQRRVGEDASSPTRIDSGAMPAAAAPRRRFSQSRKSVAWSGRPGRNEDSTECSTGSTASPIVTVSRQARDVAVGDAEEVIGRGHPLDSATMLFRPCHASSCSSAAARGEAGRVVADARRGRSRRTARRTRPTRRSSAASRRLPRPWWAAPPCGRRWRRNASESQPCSTATVGSSSPRRLAALDPQAVAADLDGVDPVAAAGRHRARLESRLTSRSR